MERDADRVGVHARVKAEAVAPTREDPLAVPAIREGPTPDAAVAGVSRRPDWRALLSLV